MDSPNAPERAHAQRIQQLAESRQRILAMSAEDALAAILDHPQPAALVHSFPETDLHFLIHDIGLQDALPIIQLASNRQWEYLLDVETWHRDRLNNAKVTTWLGLLLQAAPQRLIQWCFDEKLEFMELVLFRNIDLYIRETDQSDSDLGEGYFTDDDTYYVRFVDYPATTPAEEAQKNQRNAMLGELLHRISIFDHPRYQGLLLEAASLIPAEIEEELYRLRNVRLAEKGFLPFHEAIGIYQPLSPGELAAKGNKAFGRPSADTGQLPVPGLAARFLEGDDLFVRGLKSISDPHVLDLLQVELASLCNQVITADDQPVHGRDQLAAVVKKVSGYLSSGLERAISGKKGQREALAAKLLQRHLLADLFRCGFAGALDLHWQATRWRKGSWFQSQKLGLTFWDEAWMGLLGGLLLGQPKFYDPSMTDGHYRDFRSAEEIEATRQGLNQVVAIDRLLADLVGSKTPLTAKGFLTFKNLLLTLWARSWLKLSAGDLSGGTIAVSRAAFRDFYQWLWTEKAGRRIIDDTRKEHFIDWLAEASGMPDVDLRERLGSVFERLFKEIERELAPVLPGNLDPRYIQLFLLKT